MYTCILYNACTLGSDDTVISITIAMHGSKSDHTSPQHEGGRSERSSQRSAERASEISMYESQTTIVATSS